MISIDEALALIRQYVRPLPACERELRQLPGYRLAEPVVSDIDSPPFDKSMMDGVAVRAADFADGIREFECVGEILAGDDSSTVLAAGQTIRIMTGAPVPAGADAVVMIEETNAREPSGNSQIRITGNRCDAGQNILRRAATMACGQRVFPAGHRIRAHDVGVLAESGAARCRVTGQPSLAVIATGNELVPVNTRPHGSQIRNSNGPMIAAMAGPWCCEVVDLGIAPDTAGELQRSIETGLQSSVLVLSGGVSAGVADLVPRVLEQAGVEPVFHKVSIKPGKPIWFGQLPRAASEPPTLVFGLPGNPVSSLCCFHVFVRPALEYLAGRNDTPELPAAWLATDHRQRAGRTTYWPAAWSFNEQQQRIVRPLDWKGSADLLTLSAANCFAVFDGDRSAFSAGSPVPILCLA